MVRVDDAEEKITDLACRFSMTDQPAHGATSHADPRADRFEELFSDCSTDRVVAKSALHVLRQDVTTDEHVNFPVTDSRIVCSNELFSQLLALLPRASVPVCTLVGSKELNRVAVRVAIAGLAAEAARAAMASTTTTTAGSMRKRKLAVCHDDADNDGDGFTDADDNDCRAHRADTGE